MRLGIVVTDERFASDVIGLLRAALARGWKSRCFLTDRGVLLLKSPGFIALVSEGKSSVAVCELSIERFAEPHLDIAAFKDRVVIGGQYQDAELVRHSDKVLVF